MNGNTINRTGVVLDELLRELTVLATYGRGRVGESNSRWLSAIGILVDARGADGSQPRRTWLDATLPCADRRDLLCRSLLRDPNYRLHVDIVVGAILQTIGATGRWSRLEGLLFHSFRYFIPRFSGLLDWVSVSLQKEPYELTIEDWQNIDAENAGPDAELFRNWDKTLWGGGSNYADMFPLLEKLYLTLTDVAVFFSDVGTETENAFLAKLILAARDGEGVLCTSEELETCKKIAARGAPLRLAETDKGKYVAGLCGCIEFAYEKNVEKVFHEFAPGVCRSAKNSRLVPASEHDIGCDLWQIANEDACCFGFISVETDGESWPDRAKKGKENDDNIVAQTGLPWGSELKDLVVPRKNSPRADESLALVARHLFYGFLIQILLLEALDRELGEETLILAPPTGGRVDDLEGATHVFYRPRQAAGEVWGHNDTLDLGLIDDVLSEVAVSVGLEKVFVPFKGPVGPWSLGLRLMRSADLVRGRFDRWTLAPHVLDRLHAGGMMTGVIRRGKGLRDRLHKALHEQWDQHRRSVGELVNA
ncbi:MAG: hypothetical protein AB2605_02585 [Candidatus Thiodiazotropha sp.]